MTINEDGRQDADGFQAGVAHQLLEHFICGIASALSGILALAALAALFRGAFAFWKEIEFRVTDY